MEATMPLFYLPYIICAGMMQVMFDTLPSTTKDVARRAAEELSAE